MKIYSITEIVKATNNLYNRANNNVKKESFENIKTENEPLILSEPIEEVIVNQKHKLKESKNIKSTKKNEAFNVKKKSIEDIQGNKKKEEIVNELFLVLKRKIRKNTIKIIVDQQLENKKLKEIISDLRKSRPDMALSSDFIVGFPGESDEDFEETIDLIKEVKFSQAYSFKYSVRPGTPAGSMAEQVPDELKDERLFVLQDVLKKQQLRKYYEKF